MGASVLSRRGRLPAIKIQPRPPSKWLLLILSPTLYTASHVSLTHSDTFSSSVRPTQRLETLSGDGIHLCSAGDERFSYAQFSDRGVQPGPLPASSGVSFPEDGEILDPDDEEDDEDGSPTSG